MSQQYSSHHRIPRSRGGKRTVLIPNNFHKAWHTIFGNLFGDETEEFVRELDALFKKKKRITQQDIHMLREACRK